MDIQTLEFMSMKEFEDWKADEEIRSSSKFIRSSGNHPGNGRTRNQATVYVYYACQRSGNLRDRRSSGEPSKKSNRITSLKIDGLCTASISLIHDKQVYFLMLFFSFQYFNNCLFPCVGFTSSIECLVITAQLTMDTMPITLLGKIYQNKKRNGFTNSCFEAGLRKKL